MKNYDVFVLTSEGWVMYQIQAHHMREVFREIESKQYMWILDAIRIEVTEEGKYLPE